ncbi:hypothetical protein BX070DRAFT_219154 [Coemansia spiralis]|nr:hypothetical protein BX070DRAFT_219154 [Coemansia spiralis]
MNGCSCIIKWILGWIITIAFAVSGGHCDGAKAKNKRNKIKQIVRKERKSGAWGLRRRKSITRVDGRKPKMRCLFVSKSPRQSRDI